MEKNWVCIFSTDTSFQAEIVKEVLELNEIDAVIINKQDSNYLFGSLDIYVERDNAIRGKHLLSNIDLNAINTR
jgi:hypothetical protein